jgi:succinate-acetate transporter protein
MATISAPPPTAIQEVRRNGAARRDAVAQPIPTTLNWGNSAPLALLAFGIPTFMLSMVNANAISSGVEPVVFAVALMCGLTGLIAGIIQLRTDNTLRACCSVASARSGYRCSRSRSGS